MRRKGQAMAEFAVILPLLLFMTLGAVYFALSYAQKSVMTGVAFMGARASLVRPPDAAQPAAERILKRFKQQGGSWLSDSQVRLESGQVLVSQPGGFIARWGLALRRLLGQSGPSPQVTVGIRRTSEHYDLRTGRPKTWNVVNYSTLTGTDLAGLGDDLGQSWGGETGKAALVGGNYQHSAILVEKRLRALDAELSALERAREQAAAMARALQAGGVIAPELLMALRQVAGAYTTVKAVQREKIKDLIELERDRVFR